jgi:hypothetical protein
LVGLYKKIQKVENRLKLFENEFKKLEGIIENDFENQLEYIIEHLNKKINDTDTSLFTKVSRVDENNNSVFEEIDRNISFNRDVYEKLVISLNSSKLNKNLL